MKTNLEKLNVPYIEAIHGSDADDVINKLEELGERRTIDSIGWKNEFPYHPLTTFSVAHSDKSLYIDFFVRSNYLRAMNYETNSAVYEDSAVGFFLQPHTGSSTYYSFMFNCIGTVSGEICREGHKPQQLPKEHLDRIIRFASCGTRPFRELEGLFTWNVVAELPLDIIGIKYEGHPIMMKGNFYKCASGTQQPHFLAWQPVKADHPDFHRPEFFGDIELD